MEESSEFITPQKAKDMLMKHFQNEPVAESLAQSENIKPYIEILGAMMGGENTDSLMALMREIPLERRYIWRIVSALKWGLADFDSATVKIDRDTLPSEKVAEIIKELESRAMQIRWALKALQGA